MKNILISALTAQDLFLRVMVVLAACGYLRKVRPVDQPLLSAALYLVAISQWPSPSEGRAASPDCRIAVPGNHRLPA